MTGAELEAIRESWGMSKVRLAIYIGYTGSHRNIEMRIRKMEHERLIPLHLARYVWLINDHFIRHGSLPHWPNNLLIEGEDEPWKTSS